MPIDTPHTRFLVQLKEVRLRRGLTHSKMAEAIGLSRAQYTALENGRSMLTLQHLHNVAVVLNVRFVVGKDGAELADTVAKSEL